MQIDFERLQKGINEKERVRKMKKRGIKLKESPFKISDSKVR